MRCKTLFLLFFLLWQHMLAYAQTYRNHPYGLENYTAKEHKRGEHKTSRWCGVHTAGIVVLGIGAGTLLVGAITAHSVPQNELFSSDINVAPAIVLGALICVIGGGLTEGGIIHDNNKHHITFIAPKNNEVGFAYNF